MVAATCAQVTGSYSISGHDLRVLLALLQPVGGGGEVPSHAALLLRTLAGVAAHAGPASFFDFGDHSAGVMRHPPLKYVFAVINMHRNGDIEQLMDVSLPAPNWVRPVRTCHHFIPSFMPQETSVNRNKRRMLSTSVFL